MNCSECRELLVEYLLGEIEESESAAIEKHLNQGCSKCRDELNALAESIELLYETEPASELSAERQARIFERSVAGQRNRLESRSRGLRFLQCIAATAAGFLVCFAAIPPKRDAAVDEPARPMAGMNQSGNTALERVEQLPSVSLVSFNPSRLENVPELGIAGAVVVDQLSSELHMLGRRIGPEIVGMDKLLTIQTAERVFTYEVESGRDGILKAIVPLPMGAIEKIGLVAREKAIEIPAVESPTSEIET